MKNWEKIEDAFDLLNDECLYLVLRNFEGFFDDILLEGHNDIDVLCANKKERKKMVRILQAEPRIGIDNGIHYRFLYKGQEVALDIRTVGDGYYDEKWQKKMIKTRIYNSIGFYTMNDENYFYSLAYHAMYQKPMLSEEYLIKLQSMKSDMRDCTKENLEICLLEFMKKNGYYYTKTYDQYVVLYFNNELLNSLIKYPANIRARHLKEKCSGYIFGKMNGARVRLQKHFRKNK